MCVTLCRLSSYCAETYCKPNQTGLEPDIFPTWARNFLKTDTKQEVKWIFRETAEQNLAHSLRTESLPSRWTFAEVMRSAAARRGARRDKKKGDSLWAKSFRSSFSPPFVCALIVEPSLFRRAALFMTQPQTRSRLARAHTHTLMHGRHDGSPDTNLVSWVSRRAPIQPYLSVPS